MCFLDSRFPTRDEAAQRAAEDLRAEVPYGDQAAADRAEREIARVREALGFDDDFDPPAHLGVCGCGHQEECDDYSCTEPAGHPLWATCRWCALSAMDPAAHGQPADARDSALPDLPF